jgi:DNA-binding MarR family transcriptional regulator
MQTSTKDTAGPEFDLEHFIPYRLSVLTNTVSRGISLSYLEKYRISVIEWRVIAVLGPFPGLTASEITARTAMEKVPISRAVKTLTENGLLESHTDPDDRRCRRLKLTSRGRVVFDDIIPRALAYEAALLETLSPEEARHLTHLLTLLQQRAQRLNDI